MASTDVLEPGQILEVLANIDLGTKRWRRKARLIGIIGRWGELEEIGYRQLARRAQTGLELVQDLMGELVQQRIIVEVFQAVGSRATVYAVNPIIEQWGTDRAGRLVAGGVPWERDVDAVARWVFHAEHQQYAEPALRAVGGARTARNAQQRAVGGARTARNAQQRAVGGARTARNDFPARGLGAARRAQSVPDPQEEFPPHGEGSTSSPPTGGAGGRSTPDSGEWRALRGAVLAAAASGRGGAKFLNGPPQELLVELYHEVGHEQLLDWLPEAPADLQVPRLVEWLADQRCRPTDAFLAKLDERARRAELEAIESGDLGGTTAGTVGGMSDEPGFRYREFTGHEDQGARPDPDLGRELARQARAGLKGSTIPSPDDTMTGTPGGSTT